MMRFIKIPLVALTFALTLPVPAARAEIADGAYDDLYVVSGVTRVIATQRHNWSGSAIRILSMMNGH